MKKILFLAILLSFSTIISPSVLKKIKVYVNDTKTIELMAKKGLAVDEVIYNRSKKTLEMFVNEYELSLINSMGLKYEILIEDWVKYYQKKNYLSPLEKKSLLTKTQNNFGLTHFHFGSMGGFYTLAEVYAQLDSMHSLYPDLITEKDSIGNTIENRPIYSIKISDNPNTDEAEPEVLYTSLIHAREPEGMMTVLYFMYYLLENYNTDPAVKYLVDNRELFFIPVINPDGYYFNQQEFPDGGGWWRKNRRLNEDSTYGVDLNRNFGPYELWNADNDGSSTEPPAESYRGKDPFSEPETQAIRDFLSKRKIRTCLNYHTFSNLLIYPYGALSRETPDSLIFREYAQDMTVDNNYTYGLDRELLYSTRGGSDDFMYSDTTERSKILSMTPEVGDLFDAESLDTEFGNGFWPLQRNIVPIARENLYSNLYIAWAAGSYFKLNSYFTETPYINPGDSVSVYLDLKNKGLLPSDDIKLSMMPLDNKSSVSSEPVQVDKINEHSSLNFRYPRKIEISKSAYPNDNVKLQLNTYYGNSLINKDTINLKIGTPIVLFNDSCNTPSNLWEFSGTANWELTNNISHSSPACYTDSKNGKYPLNSKTILTSKDEIDLSGKPNCILSYWTRYDIGKIGDFGKTEISLDSGITWIPLSGKYTRVESQEGLVIGPDVYNGSQYDWVKEEMDLSSYINNKIKLRFSFTSTGVYNRDGWYIDDINILSYPVVPAGIADQNKVLSFKLEQNYPNPFNPVTIISYSIPDQSSFNKVSAVSSGGSFVSLKIYNILGQEVAVLVNKDQSPGNYKVKFDGSRLASGTYFYRLQAGDFVKIKKMLLIK